jgi:hypothetical protein
MAARGPGRHRPRLSFLECSRTYSEAPRAPHSSNHCALSVLALEWCSGVP